MYNDKTIYSTFINENKKKDLFCKKISELCNLINKSDNYSLMVSISDKDDDENEEIITINIIS
jgi:hypothetical protein